MIDLELEKSRTLTTEQITMILDLAAQAASDGGFIVTYIFERAIAVFAAQVLYPENKEELAAMIGNGYDIRLAFDTIVSNGLLEQMMDEHKIDIDILFAEGETWLKEVKDFQQSARGILDSINTLSGDIVQAAAQKLQEVAAGDVSIVQEFADRWGFDRPAPGEDKGVDKGEIAQAFELIKGEQTE